MHVVPLKKAFRLATDILSLYCLGPEQELDVLRPDPRGRFLRCGIDRRRQGLRSFRSSNRLRTSRSRSTGGGDAEDVARNYAGCAGFLLGFAVALRLQAAVAGGAR
jgi:hypothetical protein